MEMQLHISKQAAKYIRCDFFERRFDSSKSRVRATDAIGNVGNEEFHGVLILAILEKST